MKVIFDNGENEVEFEHECAECGKSMGIVICDKAEREEVVKERCSDCRRIAAQVRQ